MNTVFICKIIGALMVAAVGVYASAEYRRSVDGAISAARDAERLLRYIGENIEYRGDEVGVIIASYVSQDKASGEVWQRAAETSLADALKKNSLPFDPDTYSLLSEFASMLGRGYREPQAELCRIYSARIARVADSLESSKKDRLRVSTAVCVFAVLSVIIFFI